MRGFGLISSVGSGLERVKPSLNSLNRSVWLDINQGTMVIVKEAYLKNVHLCRPKFTNYIYVARKSKIILQIFFVAIRDLNPTKKNFEFH